MAVTVEEYQITQKDIEDKVFFKESQKKNQNGDEGDEYDQEDYSRDIRDAPYSNINRGMNRFDPDDPVNFEEEYDILDIKIFPEVVLVNGRQ